MYYQLDTETVGDATSTTDNSNTSLVSSQDVLGRRTLKSRRETIMVDLPNTRRPMVCDFLVPVLVRSNSKVA
jgi:hypothetical protein